MIPRPELDPDADALAPTEAALTCYDKIHLITYLRLLDAAADSADWREVARIVLHVDPDKDPASTLRTFESHMARARWMSRYGYRLLLREPD
jgi:hypothetical protein